MWVWVFVCVYFLLKKAFPATHFAITFPILPKISLKTKTVKHREADLERILETISSNFLILLIRFEAQGVKCFKPIIVLFFDGGTRTLEKYIDLFFQQKSP